MSALHHSSFYRLNALHDAQPWWQQQSTSFVLYFSQNLRVHPKIALSPGRGHMVTLVHLSPHTKLHLDRLSHFCMNHKRFKQTNRPTDRPRYNRCSNRPHLCHAYDAWSSTDQSMTGREWKQNLPKNQSEWTLVVLGWLAEPSCCAPTTNTSNCCRTMQNVY